MIALDWRKQKGEESGQYSYRMGNVWHVVQYGPGYSNTFKVTEFDAQGLVLLLRDERKEEPRVQDKTVQP